MFAVAGDEADFRLLPLGHRDDGRGEQLLADKVRPTRLAFFHEFGKVEDRKFAVIDRLDALVHGEQNAVARRVGRGAQFLLNRLGTGGVAGEIDQFQFHPRRHPLVLDQQVSDRLKQIRLRVEQRHHAHVVCQRAKDFFSERRQTVVGRLGERELRRVAQRQQVHQQHAHDGHQRCEQDPP